MQVVEVKNRKLAKTFIEVNVALNRSNPCYIRPLDKDIDEIFDPQTNKSFRFGKAIRWVLQNEQGQYVGRIAAFTNTKYLNKGTEFPVGGLGFFDCINDQAAANQLFDTAKEWLQAQGMAAMDGPINFGDRDKWWGLLVEGFDKEPMFGMPFNPPYYEQLFDGYGFQNYYNQYYYDTRVDIELPSRFPERHARFKSKPDYSARHLDKGQIEKFANDFATIYNQAWAQHDEGKEITVEQCLKLFTKMKPIMDERIIWFAYYREAPIGLWINIPDLNQYFKHFNGKFGLWQKLHLLWMKRTGQCKKFTGLVFGVVPKFQALGIDSYLIYEGSLLIQGQKLYDQFEMGWAGDWNPKMINIYRSLGAEQSRRLVTYRYLFDPTQPFERHPPMEYV